MQEKNRIFGGTKKFNFSNFQTDRQRIDQYEQEKKTAFSKFPLKSNEEKIENKISKLDKNIIEQPVLRFKPRTDLERVFENINKNTYGKVSQKIINEHLSLMNNNEVTREKEDKEKLKEILKSFGKVDEKILADLQTQKDSMIKEGYTESNSEAMKKVCTILNHFNTNKTEDDKAKKKMTKYEKLKQINGEAAIKFMKQISNKKMHFKGATLYYTGYNNKYKNEDEIMRKISKSQNIYSKKNKDEEKDMEFYMDKENDKPHENVFPRKKKNSKDFEIKSFIKKEKMQMIVDPKTLRFNYLDEAEADMEFDALLDDDKLVKNFITKNKDFSYLNNYLRKSKKLNSQSQSKSPPDELNTPLGAYTSYGRFGGFRGIKNNNNNNNKNIISTGNTENNKILETDKNNIKPLLYLKQLAESNTIFSDSTNNNNIISTNNNSVYSNQNLNKENKKIKEKLINSSKIYNNNMLNNNNNNNIGGSFIIENVLEDREEIKKCKKN
jgi:hypothetical protein